MSSFIRAISLFNVLLSFCHASHASAHVRRYDAEEIQVDASKHDIQFFNFVTRPDIDAPRWKIEVYNESALAPGYWFASPYGVVEQITHDKPYVGPHIYTQDGELVWSGTPDLDGYDAFVFKVSEMHGEDVLTFLYPHDNSSYILNNKYEIIKTVDTGVHGVTSNMHDFQLVENGTKALYLNKHHKKATLEDSKSVGYDGRCWAQYTGIEERDIATDEVLFTWTPEGKIGLDETTMTEGKIENKCDGSSAWDYLHMNSIEKLPNGDYLCSGRRSYALYQVSHKDGSILWRFGGKRNDVKFKGDLHFSGQHDARCLFQNETHMIITIMDNAAGPGVPHQTNPNSRGLVMMLNTQTLEAEEIKSFNHPNHGYAPARGNFQTLPNGNAFICWTDRALQSEHTPDGKTIMKAHFPSGLKSYRAYKYPWVGRPSQPPDVYSEVVSMDDALRTVVYVSWNGATEVDSWNLYRSNSNGNDKELLGSTQKSGFETALIHIGYAKYVVVEGVDAEGNSLGSSKVMQTHGSPNNADPAVLHELAWQKDHEAKKELSWQDEVKSILMNPIFTFVAGILFSAAVVLIIWGVWKVSRKGMFAWRGTPKLYAALAASDEDLDQVPLTQKKHLEEEPKEPYKDEDGA